MIYNVLVNDQNRIRQTDEGVSHHHAVVTPFHWWFKVCGQVFWPLSLFPKQPCK